jgi:hypothetical protein
MSLKTELATNTVLDINLRTGGYLDRSDSAQTVSLLNTPIWTNTDKGKALKMGQDVATVSGGLVVADSPSLQFTSGTYIVFGDFSDIQPSARLISKRDAGATHLEFQVSVAGTTMSLYDGVNTSSFNVDYTDAKMLAVTFTQSGKPLFYKNGLFLGEGVVSMNIIADDAPVYIGNIFAGNKTLTTPLTEAMMIDTVLTGQQLSELYEEYCSEGHIGTLGKRNFQLPQPIDTDAISHFSMDKCSGKIIDLVDSEVTSSGDVQVVSCDGVFENALDFNGTKSVSLTSTTKYQIKTRAVSFWIKPNTTVSGTKVVFSSGSANWYVGLTATNNVITSYLNGSLVQVTKKPLSANTIVVNKWNHVLFTTETVGSNVTTKIYIDNAELFDSTETTGHADISGSDFLIGGFTADVLVPDVCLDDIRVYDSIPTEAKRDEIYEQGAKKLIYRNTFEDAQVTLGTSSDDLNGWSRQTGTWKIGEDATGKYLECVTAGQVTEPLPNADTFTTNTFTISGTPTLTKTSSHLEIDAVAGDKIYSVIITI